MDKHGDEIHVSESEASGGSKEGVVRWVLVIGTLLAIVLLSSIWIFGAATQGDAESEATVSGKIAAEEDDDSTDSIVSDDADDIEGAPETAPQDMVGTDPTGN